MVLARTKGRYMLPKKHGKILHDLGLASGARKLLLKQ